MRRLAVLTAALVLLAFSAAWAEDAPKLAILDVQSLVDNSKHGQVVSARVIEFTEKKKAEVEKKLDEREKRAVELEKQLKSGIMAEDAAKKKVEEFQAYASAIDVMAREAEVEARKFANEQKMAIIKDLESIIDRISAERGYDLVLRYENVVYSADSIPDITKDVIKEYDAIKKDKK